MVTPGGREVLTGKGLDGLYPDLGSCRVVLRTVTRVLCVSHLSKLYDREHSLRATLPAAITHWFAALEARLSNGLSGTLLARV